MQLQKRNQENIVKYKWMKKRKSQKCTCCGLTVARLEVPVNHVDASLLVQVAHALSNLSRPIHYDLRGQTVPLDDMTYWSPSGIFHDQAEVWRGETNSHQLDDVSMVEEPEQLRFLPDALDHGRDVLGRSDRRNHKQLDGDFFTPPFAPVYVPERPVTDHVAERQQLSELYLYRQEFGNAEAREDAHLVVHLSCPPSFVARNSSISGGENWIYMKMLVVNISDHSIIVQLAPLMEKQSSIIKVRQVTIIMGVKYKCSKLSAILTTEMTFNDWGMSGTSKS